MKTILLSAAVLGAATSARALEKTRREFPADAIKEIRVSAESGDIEIQAASKVEVDVLNNKKPELCLLTIEAKDGALVLKAESADHGMLRREGCGAGFRVRAPAALPVDAKAGSGDLRLEGVKGNAVLATGSGKISGTLSGRLSAKIGSGDLSMKGLKSGAEVRTGSGNIALAWSMAPAEAVDITAGSGNVVLAFPSGTKLRARQLSGSGTAVNEFGDTPGASLKVSVKTGSGDSAIRAAN